MGIKIDGYDNDTLLLTASAKVRGEEVETVFSYGLPQTLDEVRDLYGERAVLECFTTGMLADLDREHARMASGGRDGKAALRGDDLTVYRHTYPLCQDWRAVLREKREAAAAERKRKAAEAALAKLSPEDRAALLKA
jgi:hypothetical protein